MTTTPTSSPITVTSIDTTFNVQSDAGGKDPDTFSRTLNSYHWLLWNKPLPSGEVFTLERTGDPFGPFYLRHASRLGSFLLTSDAITHSLKSSYVNRVGQVVQQVSEDYVQELYDAGCTVGAFTVFPGEVRDGKPTLNGARGMHPRICDRFDLTLECIRRYYLAEASPLSEVLGRYVDFFEVFGDFRSYVEFFLLDDLVDASSGKVRFYLPLRDFETAAALPQSVGEYQRYREGALAFIAGRNERIQNWAAHHFRSDEN